MVTNSIGNPYDRWRLDALLKRHTALRVVPSESSTLLLSGELSFDVQGPRNEPINDCYSVEIEIPSCFPSGLPMAKETGGRIPDTFHKLSGGWLCLGAPTALRLTLTQSPTLLTYVDEFLIPYLFGYSHFVKYGEMPFGELDHDSEGIREYIAELFCSEVTNDALAFLQLASMKRREANRHICPCRSGRRLGRCHNRRVNELRGSLSRKWFRGEYSRVRRSIVND